MQLTYEQCPWDEQHVRGLYPILASLRIDSEWRPFPLPKEQQVGRYRLFGSTIFQAIYADEEHELFKDLMDIEPPNTLDDAEWQIAKDEESYYLTTSFARAVAPTVDFTRLNNAFAPLDIDFVKIEKDLVGEVSFKELTTSELAAAMRKILLVEKLCLGINRQMYDLLDGLWEVEVMRMESEAVKVLPSELTLGGKSRKPI